MAEVNGGGLTQDQVTALIAAQMPQPASAAPPAVALNSTPGTAGTGAGFARADHTHQSRLQARLLQLTFDANGESIYTFPLAYDTGIVPIVEVTAMNTRGAAYYYDASVIVGSTTNTQVTICIRKTPRTVTVTLLGAVTSLFTNAADTVWVNIMSRAPS